MYKSRLDDLIHAWRQTISSWHVKIQELNLSWIHCEMTTKTLWSTCRYPYGMCMCKVYTANVMMQVFQYNDFEIVYAQIYIYIHIYIYIIIYIYIYTYIFIHIYILFYTYTHTYIYILYTYLCVFGLTGILYSWCLVHVKNIEILGKWFNNVYINNSIMMIYKYLIYIYMWYIYIIYIYICKYIYIYMIYIYIWYIFMIYIYIYTRYIYIYMIYIYIYIWYIYIWYIYNTFIYRNEKRGKMVHIWSYKGTQIKYR